MNQIDVPKRNQAILLQLRGEPNTANDTDWRWGNRDGLSLNPQTGEWYDHSEEKGGKSSFGLAMHLADMAKEDAIQFVNGLSLDHQFTYSSNGNTKQNPGLSKADKIKKAQEIWSKANAIAYDKNDPDLFHIWAKRRNLCPDESKVFPDIRWIWNKEVEGTGIIIAPYKNDSGIVVAVEEIAVDASGNKCKTLPIFSKDNNGKWQIAKRVDKKHTGPTSDGAFYIGDWSSEAVYITEGIADAIATVSRYTGLALAKPSKKTAWIWERLEGKTFHLLYDNDDEGQSMAMRMADFLYKKGETVFVHTDPFYSDPADAAEKGEDDRLYSNVGKYLLENPNPFPHYNVTEWDLGVWIGKEIRESRYPLAYNPDTAEWYKATQTHWERTDWDLLRISIQARYLERVKQTIAETIAEAVRIESDGLEKEMKGLLRKIRDRNPFNSTGFLDGIRSVLYKEFEKPPPYMIASQNGVVDVRDLSVTPFDPKIHTHQSSAPVPYISDQDSPIRQVWEQGIIRWFPIDVGVYAQLIFGAAMVARLSKKYLIVLGVTNSGKSTFIQSVMTSLGSMACSINEQLFDARSNHNSGLCDLIEHQQRIAVLQEAQKKMLRGDILNQLTGRDTITSRRPNGRKLITGTPVAVPIFVGEAVPQVRGMTGGTINRQVVLPLNVPSKDDKFDPSFGEEKALDPNSDLCQGAFAWLVEGANEYLAEGTGGTPHSVQEAQLKAIHEQNPFVGWALENPEKIIGHTASNVLGFYRQDVPDTDSDEITNRSIGRMLSGIGYDTKQKKVEVEGTLTKQNQRVYVKM